MTLVTRLSLRAAIIATLLWTPASVPADVIDFEDLSLAPNSAWNGPDLTGAQVPGPYGGTEYIGSFTSGGAQFSNRYEDVFGSWSGFAYSNQTVNDVPGFGSQFAAFPGTPTTAGNFAVAFGAVAPLALPSVGDLIGLPFMTVPSGMVVTGARIANTTYTALSMAEGDMFAKKFGGPSGTDPDYLRVKAYGVDAFNNVFSLTPEFYLADFRSANSADDYILNSWEWFDLSGLSGAERIFFNIETSDVGMSGPNTPTYFALDDIGLAMAPVPEPSSGLLALVALAGWRLRARCRQARMPK